MRIGRVALLVLVVLAALALGCHLWAYWHYRAGQQASALRDFGQAQERFEKCLNVWFLSARTHLEAGTAARRAGRLSEAAKHLRQSETLAGHDDAVELELMLLRAQQGGLASVQQDLEGLLEQNHPQSAAILEVLVPAYLQTDQLNSALGSIDKWLEIEPKSLEAWRFRAQLFSRLQIAPRLLESQRKILELDPDNDEVRQQIASQLLRSRQPDAALEEYERLRARLGDKSEILIGLAACQSVRNQPEEASRLLEQVLAREPHNALALAERGRIAMQRESPAEAERWLRQSLVERPAEHDVLYSLYQCLLKLGKQREAAEIQAKFKAIEVDLAHLREAILQVGATPHDPEPRYKAGLILLRNGKDKEGLRWIASALAENPRHAASRRALADYYERSGDLDQAARFRGTLP
jgi:Tfp pilus assembly protein PilF